MNITLTVDDDTLEGARSLPKRMSASRMFRHLIKAATYSEAQWTEYKKTDECIEGREALRPIRERLIGR
jgi:hypothetical protein